jgi:hypothetical protein
VRIDLAMVPSAEQPPIPDVVDPGPVVVGLQALRLRAPFAGLEELAAAARSDHQLCPEPRLRLAISAWRPRRIGWPLAAVAPA